MATRLPLNRYYVHGDLAEDQPNTYFCAICDSFEPPSHFDDSKHVEMRAERYTHRIESWKQRAARNEVRRPANAENILAAAVADDLKKAKSAQSPFYRWILKQIERDDSVGDLARDVKDDRSFPFSARTKKEIEMHFWSNEARMAFREAWSEFRPRRASAKP